MRYPLYLSISVLFLSDSVASAVEPSDLKPALIATFSAGKDTITRLEPTVALTLKAGEAPHPKLSAISNANWKGYINITRPGQYAFAANVLNGRLRVEIGGKLVLDASGENGVVTEVQAKEVQLEGGVQPFSATFESTLNQPTRAELFWRGPGFVQEPLPHQFLGHLAKDRPAQFTTDLESEYGRFRFEELGCIQCHKPENGDAMARTLVNRTGPTLTAIADRAYPGWIDAWLADPSAHRPQTTMPKMFGDDELGQAERYAVTKYLVSLSKGILKPYKPQLNPPNNIKQSFERGRVLYTVAGCATCHQEAKPKPKNEEDEREPLQREDYVFGLGTLAGPTAKYALGSPGSKTRPEAMAKYLQDPLKTQPAGRMPHMNLNAQEAGDLALYLCRLTDDKTEPGMPAPPTIKPAALGKLLFEEHFGDKAGDEIAALEKLPDEGKWLELGRTLTDVKGCINCHTIEENGKPRKPRDAFPKLTTIKSAGEKGCISEQPNVAKTPVYKFENKDVSAIAAFLKSGLNGNGSLATAYSARIALKRFNCLNCHSRDGEGGIPTDLADQMRVLEKAENADDVRPPLLTGVGHKSRTSWLKSVLTNAGRARPWMQLRMPQYGNANVGFLPEALAAIEGTSPDDAIHTLPLNPQTIALGRQIVGKGGLGCISCHDIGGVANTGTRGPDLATINQRVRYEWYERWMHQPLRMAPGTRMPQAFVAGKSTLSTVLNGDPKAQASAMWSYLSLGSGLPLPEGLEPPKGLILSIKDRPELLRTFMPDAGNKAIAVGYPGGVHLAFSADECRLAYAWAGNFLDASPVWNNRGGAPAKLLGPKFWSANGGHPWALTGNPNIPPDFIGRSKNPAFGVPLPLEPARIYDGPRMTHFDGYSLDQSGNPTFRYRLTENTTDAVLRIAETPAPLRTSVATGFTRHFAIEAPAGYRTWLLSGESVKEPRLISAIDATGIKLDLKANAPLNKAEGVRVLLPQENGKIVVIEASRAPAGTTWQFVSRTGGGWLAVLRFPESKETWKGEFDLLLWSVPRDDDALIKDLLTK